MALAYTLPWLFTSRQIPYVHNTNAYVYRTWNWNLKEMLKDMGWTVRSSGDGKGGFGNNDDVDWWPTVDDFIRSGSNAFYQVMRPPLYGTASNLSLCFGQDYSSNQGALDNTGIAISPNDGFTGGGAAPPTSTDDIIFKSLTDSAQSIPGTTYEMYGAWTADGKHCRVIIKAGRVLHCIIAFSHVATPHANLDYGGLVYNARIVNSSTDPANSVLDADHYTSALWYGTVSGTARNFYLGTQGYNNTGVHSLGRVAADNKIYLAPCDLYCITAGIEGYYGTIPDLYYGKNSQYEVLLGDTVGGAPTWLSGGSLITPWDSTQKLGRVW